MTFAQFKECTSAKAKLPETIRAILEYKPSDSEAFTAAWSSPTLSAATTADSKNTRPLEFKDADDLEQLLGRGMYIDTLLQASDAGGATVRRYHLFEITSMISRHVLTLLPLQMSPVTSSLASPQTSTLLPVHSSRRVRFYRALLRVRNRVAATACPAVCFISPRKFETLTISNCRIDSQLPRPFPNT